MSAAQNLPNGCLIDRVEQLPQLVEACAGAERVAIDTEADSLHSYFEKLCLLQLSMPGSDFAVDPLAGLDLAPLFEVLRGKPLIVHGADFDLRILRRASGFSPTEVFDTLIAARLTGVTECNLAALVNAHFGVALVKTSQKADWSLRPLKPRMLEYAINDARFLLPLSERLAARLRELGRWSWFTQSCARAIVQAATDRAKDPEARWRITGSAALRGRSSAILRELWLWREKEAQQADRPPFHILRNDEMIHAAIQFDAGRTPRLDSMRPDRRRRLLAVAENALSMSDEHWPQWNPPPRLRPSEESARRYSKLKTIRDRAAKSLALDATLIASRSVLEKIAAEPACASETLLPWQMELLGLPHSV